MTRGDFVDVQKRMKEMDPVKDFWKTKKEYCFFEDEELSVWCMGGIAYLEKNELCIDLLQIAHFAIEGQLDYNELHGFYKIVIFHKMTNRYLFWGDNAGSQIFFVDKEKQIFADSLLQIRRWRGEELHPCYSAIALLLQGKGMFTGETILQGVCITDSEKYYTYQDGSICSEKKGLLSLSENAGKPLTEVMDILMKITGDQPYCAVCTGGTDSRTILSHLAYRGKKPPLIITGHKNNPDIEIAEKIAQVLELPLTVQNPAEKGSNWIEEGFQFSDGIYDPVLSYRHCKKANWAKENGFVYEFGGVGGEFYKNSFCPVFRNELLGKKPTVNLLFDTLLKPATNSPIWAGDKLKIAWGGGKREDFGCSRRKARTGAAAVLK